MTHHASREERGVLALLGAGPGGKGEKGAKRAEVVGRLGQHRAFPCTRASCVVGAGGERSMREVGRGSEVRGQGPDPVKRKILCGWHTG